MKVLSLDISSKAGFALLEGFTEKGKVPAILASGMIAGDSPHSFGAYPRNYYKATALQADRLIGLVVKHKPDAIVIEETNLGKNRYSQKMLEFTHAAFLQKMESDFLTDIPVIYISSSQWRSAIGLQMTKDQKKTNAKLSKAKADAASGGTKLDKAALGIRGKVTKKHLAIEWANATFGLSLKVKDNDIADALGLGTSFYWGAEICDGT